MKKTIEVPIYNRTVHFRQKKNVHALCLEETGEKMLPDDRGMCVRKDGEVWIFVKDGETWPIIAHESAHAANYILGLSGVRVTEDNDEALTYLMTYLLEQWD